MLRFDDRGLIPAVVQDARTRQVLTLAYMDTEALQKTLEGPDVWFYSRSRSELWHKGETSGNFLKVRSVKADCDGDALLIDVDPTGPACHTGRTSCFHNPADKDEPPEREAGPGVLSELFAVIEDRRKNPAAGSHTSKLFEEGRERIAQKVVEEAGETAIAGVGSNRARLAEETADLFYHALVLASSASLDPADIWSELLNRRAKGTAGTKGRVRTKDRGQTERPSRTKGAATTKAQLRSRSRSGQASRPQPRRRPAPRTSR
jgi:phosphoribosyl-ATP pyrophosphohydrolase/phosphoribosyl-AMP cyclohydrolase